MFKCKNCGSDKFIAFRDFLECEVCGEKHEEKASAEAPIKQEPIKEEKKEEKNKYNSLRFYFEQPSLNLSAINSEAKKIIDKDADDLCARCILAFSERENYPENYKNAISVLSSSTIDEETSKWLIPALIDHSDYKFLNSIYELLNNLGLYLEYSEKLAEARERLEKENEAFSSAPRDIFVCYSSNDLSEVERIVERLEDDGNTCWYAHRNIVKNTFTKLEYRKKTKEAMSKCKVILVVASKNSMLSDEVERELDCADELGIKNRVEYRIEDVENTARFKSFFDGIQWIDASRETQYYVLISQIYDILNPKEEPKEEVKEEVKEEPKLKKSLLANKKIKILTPIIIEENENGETVIKKTSKSCQPSVVSSDEETTIERTEAPVETANTTPNEKWADSDDLLDSKKEEKSFDFSKFLAKVPSPVLSETSITKELEEPFQDDFFKSKEEDKEDEALSLFKAGKHQDAIEILDSMDVDSFDTLTYYYIGESFEGKVKNEPIFAKAYYEKIVSEAPSGTSEDVGAAYYMLSKKYTKGEFFGEDFIKEKELLLKAANYNEPRAFYNLGIIYKSTDLEKAIEYFEKASDEIPEKSYMQLGKCYASDKNPKKDYDMARKCYEKAAQYGDTASMVNLGNIYYYGMGVTQSYADAHMWYLKAAKLGNATAQYNIGRCYQLGRGIEPNEELALEWFEKARQNGYSPKSHR